MENQAQAELLNASNQCCDWYRSLLNIGFPVKPSETPQQVRRHPPLLGEHTLEVLREYGIEEGLIAEIGSNATS